MLQLARSLQLFTCVQRSGGGEMSALRSVRLCSEIVLAAWLVLISTAAFAQIDRGQISGFVKDETGGVIPGATVTATHLQTGTARSAVTDGTGYYVLTALTPGSYEV